MEEDKEIIVVDIEKVQERFISEQTGLLPWDQQPDEPIQWFSQFQRYFIPIGPSRSVRQAYHAWMIDLKGEKPKYRATGRYWAAIARQYDWRERARQWDLYNNAIILDAVQQAHEVLAEAVAEAAETLVDALDDPRLRLQAAKEILDRAGVPKVTRSENVTVKVTGEDVRRAKEDAEAWEKTTFEQSG